MKFSIASVLFALRFVKKFALYFPHSTFLFPFLRYTEGIRLYFCLFYKRGIVMSAVHTRAFSLSGAALKRIACACMLIDHIGASLLEVGVLTSAIGRALSTAAYTRVYYLDLALRIVGRLSFPIYCFLLVEGFLHTHDVRRYGLRLFVFALLSEVPYDWAFYHTPLHWDDQNVYWTLLLGLMGMAGLRAFDGHIGHTGRNAIGRCGVALCAMMLGELAAVDYGALGVGLILLLYVLRDSRRRQCAAGALLLCCDSLLFMTLELPAVLAFPLIGAYSGARGRCSRRETLFHYIFYPAHLLVLGCITNLVLR
jgi:hypothetical protein